MTEEQIINIFLYGQVVAFVIAGIVALCVINNLKNKK